MKRNRIFKLAIFLIALFWMSFLFAIIDHGFNQLTSYELGKAVGEIFAQAFKIAGLLAIVLLGARFFRKTNQKTSTE